MLQSQLLLLLLLLLLLPAGRISNCIKHTRGVFGLSRRGMQSWHHCVTPCWSWGALGQVALGEFRNAEIFCFLVGELCFVKICFLKFDGNFFFVSFEEKQHVGEICWVVFVWHISVFSLQTLVGWNNFSVGCLLNVWKGLLLVLAGGLLQNFLGKILLKRWKCFGAFEDSQKIPWSTLR